MSDNPLNFFTELGLKVNSVKFQLDSFNVLRSKLKTKLKLNFEKFKVNQSNLCSYQNQAGQ